MRLLSLIRLTAIEGFLGQIFWVALTAGGVLVALATLMSGAALNHAGRLVDVSSYFLVDMVCFLVAAFMGAGLFAKNFSPRGLSELLVPMGVPREGLMAARILGECCALLAMVAALYTVRTLSLALTLLHPESPQGTLAGILSTSTWMAVFTFTKACLALAVAGFLGCVTRPVIAILGTVAFFFLGHYSSAVTGLRGVGAGSGGPGTEVSPLADALVKAFRVWNPNHLILESFDGSWEAIDAQAFVARVGWGALAFACFLLLCFAGVRNRSIESRETL